MTTCVMAFVNPVHQLAVEHTCDACVAPMRQFPVSPDGRVARRTADK